MLWMYFQMVKIQMRVKGKGKSNSLLFSGLSNKKLCQTLNVADTQLTLEWNDDLVKVLSIQMCSCSHSQRSWEWHMLWLILKEQTYQAAGALGFIFTGGLLTNDILKRKVIELSNIPQWQKGYGSTKLCIDNWCLNAVTKVNFFPPSHIEIVWTCLKTNTKLNVLLWPPKKGENILHYAWQDLPI